MSKKQKTPTYCRRLLGVLTLGRLRRITPHLVSLGSPDGGYRALQATACSCGHYSKLLAIASAVVLMLAAPVTAGHCQLRTYHHSKHVVAYQVPVVQNFFYGVGAGVQVEAAVQKAIRTDPDFEELQAFKRFKAQDQWKSLATGQPIAGSLPDGSPDLAIKKFCAGCHGDAKQSAGKRFDGTEAVDPLDFRAFYRMASKGEGVPKAMQTVMQKMTPEQTQQVLDELSALEAPGKTAADSEPKEDEPGVLK